MRYNGNDKYDVFDSSNGSGIQTAWYSYNNSVKTPISANQVVSLTNKGIYTFYAKDKAGNEVSKVVEILPSPIIETSATFKEIDGIKTVNKNIMIACSGKESEVVINKGGINTSIGVEKYGDTTVYTTNTNSGVIEAYTVTITDKFGKQSSLAFKVDRRIVQASYSIQNNYLNAMGDTVYVNFSQPVLNDVDAVLKDSSGKNLNKEWKIILSKHSFM